MKRKILKLTWLLLLVILPACRGQPTPIEPVPAPDFSLPNALGGEVALSDYAGQPVFLFFHMAVG